MTTASHQIYEHWQQIPYRQVYHIDRGGYGTVDAVQRTGTDPSVAEVYARKHFTLSRTPTRRELDGVLEEIRIASSLQHQHCIKLVETYQYRNTYAMIMDPVAEKNLAVFMNDLDAKPMDKDDGERKQLSRWFLCLIDAISFLHSKKIHHRDIKPQNILTLKEQVLLTDFGISKEFQEMTDTGPTDTLGTRTYRSPELDNGRRPGRREDIFSLGAVFLEMLSVISASGQLEQLKGLREGPYCQNIGKVHTWIESLRPKGSNIDWYNSMLSLCQYMLGIARDDRPYADHIIACWQFQPFLIMPPTTCDCHKGHMGSDSAAPSKDMLDACMRMRVNGNRLPHELITDQGKYNSNFFVEDLIMLAVPINGAPDYFDRHDHFDRSTFPMLWYIPPKYVQILVQEVYESLDEAVFDNHCQLIVRLITFSWHVPRASTLRQITQLIFSNAFEHHNKTRLYARSCSHLIAYIPMYITDDAVRDKNGNLIGGGPLFRKYLLNRLQEIFETRSKSEPFRIADEWNPLDSDAAAERRWLGFVRFLAELYIEGLVTTRIQFEVLRSMMDVEGCPDEITIDSIVSLLYLSGSALEETKHGSTMLDVYFERIAQIANMPDLSPSSSNKLRLLIERRTMGWKVDAEEEEAEYDWVDEPLETS